MVHTWQNDTTVFDVFQTDATLHCFVTCFLYHRRIFFTVPNCIYRQTVIKVDTNVAVGKLVLEYVLLVLQSGITWSQPFEYTQEYE